MTDQTTPLRDRIAAALYPTYGQEDRNRSLAIADAVLAVLPAPADQAADAQPLPTPAETAPADESPHVYMDCVQDSAAWAYALTKAGQIPEALEHVEAMERLLAVYRRAVGA